MTSTKKCAVRVEGRRSGGRTSLCVKALQRTCPRGPGHQQRGHCPLRVCHAGHSRRGGGEGSGLVGALSQARLFLSLTDEIWAMHPLLPELPLLPEPWLDFHTLPSHTGRVSQCMVKNPGP